MTRAFRAWSSQPGAGTRHVPLFVATFGYLARSGVWSLAGRLMAASLFPGLPALDRGIRHSTRICLLGTRPCSLWIPLRDLLLFSNGATVEISYYSFGQDILYLWGTYQWCFTVFAINPMFFHYLVLAAPCGKRAHIGRSCAL